jgi:acyl carrier protein
MVLADREVRTGVAGTVAIVVTEAQAVRSISELLEDRGADAGEIHNDTPLEELGFDSLEIAELFMMLEDALGVRFDPASATDMSTVGDFTKLLPFGPSDA